MQSWLTKEAVGAFYSGHFPTMTCVFLLLNANYNRHSAQCQTKIRLPSSACWLIACVGSTISP